MTHGTNVLHAWIQGWDTTETCDHPRWIGGNLATGHGRINYKDTEPSMSAFLQNWPVNGLCGIVFNRFYREEIHTQGLYFRPSLWTVATMDEGTILVSCCPSTFSLTSPPPPIPPSQTKCTVFTDSLWLWGCGEGGVELCCKPFSAGVLHSVSDQIQQNLQNCFTTPNKNDQ